MSWQTLLLAVSLVALPHQVHAQAKSGATTPATRSATKTSSAGKTGQQSVTSAAITDSSEQAPYESKIRALRAELLQRSGWADLGDRCNPGALRVFPRDTSAESMAEVEKLVSRVEDIIVLMGAGRRVDDVDGRSLVRTVMEWEAGIGRPYWDTADTTRRLAFATGLTGEYPDPQSDKCLNSPRSSDTVTFVVPALTEVDLRSPSAIKLKAYFGEGAVNHARNEFVAAHRGDAGATLEYIQLAPVVRWNEWAVVKVSRPLEDGGVDVGKNGNGGAVYLMRRERGQWRLFAVSRSWGR